MIGIVLYSINDNSISAITEVFKSEGGFDLYIKEPGNRVSDDGDLGGKKLAIFDITGLDINDRNETKSLAANTLDCHKSGLGIIFILDSGQSRILFENEVISDGFIFSPQIGDELIPRVNFLLLKMKILIPKDSLVVGDMILNLEKYELTVNGEIVVLTFKEFEMLKLLLQNQNKVFTRINLLSTVWGYDYYGGSRTVDVHMRRLRVKIPPPYNNMLKTIRNVGYMFSHQK